MCHVTDNSKVNYSLCCVSKKCWKNCTSHYCMMQDNRKSCKLPTQLIKSLTHPPTVISMHKKAIMIFLSYTFF